MKKILMLFMALLSGLTFWTLYQDLSHQELHRIKHLEMEFSKPFMMPSRLGASLYPLLMQHAKDSQVNLFRTSQISPSEINKFMLLTTQTRFFDDLILTEGEQLSVENTWESEMFLSTSPITHPHQVGRFTYFGERATIHIRPLIQAFDTLPFYGEYLVELPDDLTLVTFLENFIGQLNALFETEISTGEMPEFTLAEFPMMNHQGQLIRNSTLDFSQMLVFVWIITLIVGVYYISSQVKKISILKLNGLSAFRIWHQVIGKTVNGTFFITSVLIFTIAVMLGIRYRNFNFLSQLIQNQTFMYLSLLLLSLFAYVLVLRTPISHGVKNKNNKSFVFWFNSLLKMGLTVAVLMIGSQIVSQNLELTHQEALLANWDYSSNFGVFSRDTPNRVGLSTVDFDLMAYLHDVVLPRDLYPILNEKGSIYIDASDFTPWNFSSMGGDNFGAFSLDEPESLSIMPSLENVFGFEWLKENNQFDHGRHSFSLRRLRANPNYLRAFPLYDVNGNIVEISEDNPNMILLVPKKYHPFEDMIREWFNEDRNWRLWLSENMLQIQEDARLHHPNIEIIWLKNDQETFAFNPFVFPEYLNEITNAIIQVVTESNSVLFDFELMINGDSMSSLKVRLVENEGERTLQDFEETFDRLFPTLQELGLDGLLFGLLTANERMLQEIAELRVALNRLILIGASAMMVTGALALQNVMLFFKHNQQKVIIKRLLGLSFWRTYANYFYYFGALWILQLLLLKISLSFFNVETAWILVPLFLGIELLMSIGAIHILESRNKLTTLKGEE